MACTDCEDCLEVAGISCYGNVTLITGLTPSTSYYVWIQDKHGRYLVESYTTDLGGDITLDTDVDGMFHEHSGNYIVTISTSPLEETEETITVGYSTYTCILLKFIDVD